MKRTTIIEVIIFLFSILFTYTGVSKLMDYSAFLETVADSPLLAPIAKLVAWGLPPVEFVITGMLIIPKWRLKGLYASLLIMIIFTGYVIGLLIFDEKLPCSCGGILQQLSWPQHVVFNIIFILLSIWGIVLQKRLKKQHQKTWANQYQITNLEY